MMTTKSPLNIDVLYSVQRKHTLSSVPTSNFSTKCRLSSKNVLAFSSQYELNESTPCAWGCFIYVCDISSPWNVFKVTSNENCITVLEWDITGKYLLIGDSEGEIQIWMQKDNILSEWLLMYTIKFPGEKIIKAAFFHNGRKINLPADKRDIVLYMDKFQRVKFPPSVRQFGGVAAEGCIVLTATGLIGTFLIPSQGGSGLLSGMPSNPVHGQQQQQQQQQQHHYPIKLEPTTESLKISRMYFTTASISYGKTNNFGEGYFSIAVANGENCKMKSSLMVQCFKVIVKIVNGKLTIKTQSLPNFLLYEGFGRDLPDLKITHLHWTMSEDSDSLIVIARNSQGSFIEQWNLIEKVTPIHSLFQTKNSDVYKTLSWINQNSFRHTSHVTDICSSRMYFDNSLTFVSFEDNSIQIFTKDLKRVTSMIGTHFQSAFDEYHSKQPRIGISIRAHDVSFLGHILIGIDNQGQVYCFKIPQLYQEQCPGQLSLISCITTLLEYCIVTGYDASDVLISIRPNLLENIIEKLSENFTRQPSSVQQYYYVNFLTMKINLYRLLLSGQSKANDLTCLLVLHSILIAFKSLLRPADLASHDKGPAENLAMVLSESVPDVDKVLMNLDAKDFTVEPFTLQSLQQLIQWVADLALNILARLPQTCMQPNQSKTIGYEISKDIVALNSIRELLVMIRIWGLLNANCLPSFSKSVENLDLLAILFRLLTRLALNPIEPDELLLDECCLLPSQVLIPQLQFVPTVTSICSPILHLNSLPLHLTFNIEPDSLKYWRDTPPIEGSFTSDGMIDNIRNLMLGKKPAMIRKCLRCGACSSVGSVAKTSAMKAWEQRWSDSCRCGGSWILQKN